MINWYIKLSQQGIRLWLDDERDPKDPQIQNNFGARRDEVWVKTADEAKKLLSGGNVISVSLDHDYGCCFY